MKPSQRKTCCWFSCFFLMRSTRLFCYGGIIFEDTQHEGHCFGSELHRNETSFSSIPSAIQSRNAILIGQEGRKDHTPLKKTVKIQ